MADVDSIILETGVPPSDTSGANFYRIVANKKGFESVQRVEDVPDPNATGERATSLSGISAVPDEVQTAVAGIVVPLNLNTSPLASNSNPVNLKKVDIKITTANGDEYFATRREDGKEFIQQNGKPVTPPKVVIQTVQTVLPKFNP